MESADSAAQEAQTALLAMGTGFFEQMRSSGAEEGAQRTEVLDAFRKRYAALTAAGPAGEEERTSTATASVNRWRCKRPWQAAWDIVGEGFDVQGDVDEVVQEVGERTDDEYAIEEPELKEEEGEAKGGR